MNKIISIILVALMISSVLSISAATTYATQTIPDNHPVIYFDSNTVGWRDFDKLYCNIKKSGSYILPENSEDSLCTDLDNDGIWEYDLYNISEAIDNNYPVTLMFRNENDNITAHLTMEESNIGDTVLALSKSTSGIPVIIWSKDQTINDAVRIHENKTGEKVETNRYYFLMPNGENGQKGDDPDCTDTYGKFATSWYNEEANCAGIYLWEGKEFETDWPGYKMVKDYEKDVYYADVPKCVEAVIINNFVQPSDDPNDPVNKNLMQTINLSNSGYEEGVSELYPDGLESFEDMIFVIDSEPVVLSGPYVPQYIKGGEWYYYYGKGCYGTVKDGDSLDCIRDDHHHGEPTCSEISAKDALSQYELQTGEKVSTYRYYFMMPNGTNGDRSDDPYGYSSEFVPSWYNEYTDAPAIYWWGTELYNPEEFPGYTMEKGDTDDVFYADVPIDVTTVIFNNNVVFPFYDTWLGAKYDRQSINIPSEYYDPGESPNYPEGTESFDNMIFVLDPDIISIGELGLKQTYAGEWYYYYGNGCYGTVKDGDSSNCIHPSHFDESKNHISLEYAIGDVDKDGVVSVLDATEIQLLLAELKEWADEQSKALADYDSDGEISVMDATAIQLKLAELS